MNTAESWSVALTVAEHEGQTRAEARLDLGNGTHLLGHGVARRNPSDPNVLEIGEKIAAARALSDVAHMLLGSAAAQLEDVTHQEARLNL
jgi:predicted RNA methylase